MDLSISKRQKAFIDSAAFETLYGGAAGGGKSHGQVIDALLYALKHNGSKQIIFRRTFTELESSLIRTARSIYPQELCSYNASKHTYSFVNGSLIDFAYCANEDDVYKYQSAEYDVVRFDELTHFSEFQYTYLISRCRGANSFPKAIKSTTNPGGIGHTWVKARFIDKCVPNETYTDTNGSTRIFLPAKVDDNMFLMQNDPAYKQRLLNLSEKEQKALLYGDWNIFDGQYFSEFNREVHVVKPFLIPSHWRRYVSLDYGLDMLACYFIAVDEQGRAYVYKEIYQSGLIVSEAASVIRDMVSGDRIEAFFAPPDLWNKHSDTGKSTAEIFGEQGIYLVKANNNRIQGWLELHEWLKVRKDEQEQPTANLRIFENCVNLIRTLPSLQFDKKNPNDCATEPHEITHAPDAIRYFIAGRPISATAVDVKPKREIFYDDEAIDFLNYGG